VKKKGEAPPSFKRVGTTTNSIKMILRLMKQLNGESQIKSSLDSAEAGFHDSDIYSHAEQS
jgi:hypothetical protein